MVSYSCNLWGHSWQGLPNTNSVINFWISVVCIVLAISLLFIWKLLHISSAIAAYTAAAFAVGGGSLLIVSGVCLLLRKDLASAWAARLRFHLPEFIALGLVSIALAIVLFIGKIIK